MSLHFDKTEFNRHVDKDFIANVQITEEQEREVMEAIQKSPMLSRGKATIRQVAAQFKNMYMENSALPPVLIEAILTRIVLERKYEQAGWPPVVISFTDESFMYGKGVREFCFEPREIEGFMA